MGVTTLDAQHGAFIASLNDLHKAMIKGQGKSVTGPLLLNLLTKAREHFTAEEEWMTSTEYPELAHHRAEHRVFESKLEELNARHDSGETSVCIPLLRFLRDWLSTHILEDDRGYGPWLKQHGAR